MQSASHRLPLRVIGRRIAWALACCLCGEMCSFAQITSLPTINAGSDSGFAQIDFAQIYLDTQNRDWKKREELELQNRKLVDSNLVSVLDLAAPNKDVDQFNRATTLLKAQKSKEAARCLQKALADYPKFVSAHISLGLAYLDLDDIGHAKAEFETAAKLDDRFPASFLNLGRLALSQNDFETAQSQLAKAAALSPRDAKVLTSLAYAQNANHQYLASLQTVHRVHELEHKGSANAHYVGAAAALKLNDLDAVEREFQLFLAEDPTNPFAPAARNHLAVLAHNKELRLHAANAGGSQQGAIVSDSPQTRTFPNTERLKAQLSALGDEPEGGLCEDCGKLADAAAVGNGSLGAAADLLPGIAAQRGGWTIRKNVDQVTLFFAVSSHGHMVNDLEASDIRILDNNKVPDNVVQFAPQSRLPLRLALLVDTSGSVHDRSSFEKRAATKFVQKVLSSASDLAFIAGFSNEPAVTQDFTSNQAVLGDGIAKLKNAEGGTALFDAAAFACRKLAQYPDDDQVARVLVILSDGEDNSSHSTLKQAVQAAEAAGVTIYTISTSEARVHNTDADKVLTALAERSGGEAMFPDDLLTLGHMFDKLQELIRSRYFIAYKPADFQPDGSYRTIRIVAQRNGQRFQVRARKGYHARLESHHD